MDKKIKTKPHSPTQELTVERSDIIKHTPNGEEGTCESTESEQRRRHGGKCETHRWQRSPLMPLVVQKHLPLLGLHMLAWPLHLQAEPKT